MQGSLWARALIGAKKRLRVLRRIADWIPLTVLGWCIAASAVVALVLVARASLDWILLALSYGALGLMAICISFVIATAVVLKVRSRRLRMHVSDEHPLRMETARFYPTGFQLPSLTLIPFIQMRWEWLEPESATVRTHRRAGRSSEEVMLRERGDYLRVLRRVVVEDVFGLARVAFRHEDKTVLEVVPHVGGLNRMPVLASLSGGDEQPHPMGLEDGDRIELRRYAPGDPARLIHWKIFGRSRKLMVRMPERALSRARRTVAYFVAGERDEASAGAARAAVEAGAFGAEWMFCADGSHTDVRTPSEAVRLIVQSADAKPMGGVGLADYLKRAERSGPASIVVFAPPREGAWLQHVLAAARHRGRRMRVVIGVDGLVEPIHRRVWKRLLKTADRLDGVPTHELERVLGALSEVRCETFVVDRPSGRALGAAHRTAVRGLVPEQQRTTKGFEEQRGEIVTP